MKRSHLRIFLVVVILAGRVTGDSAGNDAEQPTSFSTRAPRPWGQEALEFFDAWINAGAEYFVDFYTPQGVIEFGPNDRLTGQEEIWGFTTYYPLPVAPLFTIEQVFLAKDRAEVVRIGNASPTTLANGFELLTGIDPAVGASR